MDLLIDLLIINLMISMHLLIHNYLKPFQDVESL